MGGSCSSVGTSIATKHAPNIGSSSVTLAVISVTSTMPVSGARTIPVKKSGHADDGEPLRLKVQIGESELAQQPEEQAELRTQHQQGRKQPALRSRGV